MKTRNTMKNVLVGMLIATLILIGMVVGGVLEASTRFLGVAVSSILLILSLSVFFYQIQIKPQEVK